MTKNIRITAVIAIVAIIGVTYGIYTLSGHKAPREGNVAPVEGTVSQAELDRATASLKSAINVADQLSGTTGTSFTFQAQPTYGHYGNFGLVKYVNQVKGVGLVDETAVTFHGETDNDNAEVDSKTGQVISFHRSIDHTNPGKEKTQAEIETTMRIFLNEVYPDFKQVEPTLTFSPGIKGVRLNNGNYFFDWEDNDYQKQLPEGVETERAPFIQVGITSSGYIFSYNNTIDIYRNALKEFNLTQ
ncbi:MAG: hypothetical protein WCV80_01070 [Candidatus Paceibacterota bacterium]|jgi:hypothetical protein